MDQSTQVNLSAFKSHRRRLQRHNTSAEIPLPRINIPAIITPARSPRPRSLHLSTEGLQPSKFYDGMRMCPSPSELMLNVMSQERTPPQSVDSSIITNGFGSHRTNYYYYNNQRHTGATRHLLQVPGAPYPPSDTNSPSSCKCFYEPDPNSKMPSATPEGLSWRRLHMSRAKLKATSTTSELLSGFAMVAMVELQVNEDTAVPEWLFVMFSVCTTVLVAVHIFALMISTYILPNIDAISKMDVCELVTESPHDRMKGFIELAWAFSTVLGLFLFLVEVAILCWVKFWDYSFTAAIAATVIVIPVLIIFVLFAIHFYHSLVVHRCDTSLSDMQRLEDMRKQLDEVTVPV